jgi:hypothetical protein
MNGKKVSAEELGGLAAAAALTAAGIYASRSAGRTLPRTPGARPMTTAERSVAVTRAGRTGVGKIGPSIKPQDPTYTARGEALSSYQKAIYHAQSVLSRRKLQDPRVPAHARQVNMSPAAAARARRIMGQVEQDRIERAAIRNQAWTFFAGRGGRARIKDLDRVYEGYLTNMVDPSSIRKNPRKNK